MYTAETTVIPLTLTPRQLRAQLINHLIPGLILILNGLGAMFDVGDDPHKTFAIAGMIVGGIASAVLIREFKRVGSGGHSAHHGVHWAEIAAAVIIIIEAWHKYHPGKLFQPAVCYIPIALYTLLNGLYPDGIPKFRILRIDDVGFLIRRNIVVWYRFRWNQIAGLSATGDAITVTTVENINTVIPLRKIGNAAEVSAALLGRFERLRRSLPEDLD